MGHARARKIAAQLAEDEESPDAQRIARLAEMGLLRPSFVPPAEIRVLRDWTRTRPQLVRDRAREWQRLEKLLEGPWSSCRPGWPGTRPPALSSRLSSAASGTRAHSRASPRARARLAGLEQSLDGMALGDHHARLARLHLDRIDALDRHVGAIDDEIAACLDAIPAACGITADGDRSPHPGQDAAILDAVSRLAETPGVSPAPARAIIAETGLDTTRFPTAAHLASRAGLTPVPRQSGSRSRKPGNGHGDAYLKGYCTQAAAGTATTSTFPGERLRRPSRRIGATGRVFGPGKGAGRNGAGVGPR